MVASRGAAPGYRWLPVSRERWEPLAEFRFLIIGAGRGGTSLLAGLVHAHPDVEVAFEKYAREELGDRTRSIRDRVRGFRDACEAAAAESQAKIWGNKLTSELLYRLHDAVTLTRAWRTNEVHHRTMLEPLFDELTGIRTIFIVRDGRSVVSSKVRRTEQTPEVAAAMWRFSLDIQRAIAARPESLTVKFEDLVSDPESTLGRVCEFLDIPLKAERMLRGTDSRKVPEEYRRDSLDTSVLRVPELDPEILALIEDDLREFGYA